MADAPVTMTRTEFEAEVAKVTKKPQPFPYADVVKEQERRRQRRLLQAIKGKVVVEILQIVETRTNDDVFVIFYAKGRTAGADETLVAQLWLVEQKRHRVKLEEVVHRDGKYLLDGRDFVQAVQDRDVTW